jgi:predicted flap endonuclease-1-like 5' DNA nuclease
MIGSLRRLLGLIAPAPLPALPSPSAPAARERMWQTLLGDRAAEGRDAPAHLPSAEGMHDLRHAQPHDHTRSAATARERMRATLERDRTHNAESTHSDAQHTQHTQHTQNTQNTQRAQKTQRAQEKTKEKQEKQESELRQGGIVGAMQAERLAWHGVSTLHHLATLNHDQLQRIATHPSHAVKTVARLVYRAQRTIAERKP